MIFAGRVVYRIFVSVIALLTIYAIYEVLRVGEPNSTAWYLLIAVGALALAATVASWVPHLFATYVQICVIPVLAAIYFFELGSQDPIDQISHVEEYWRLVKTKASSHQAFTIQYSPSAFARQHNGGLDLQSGDRIFPLGQVADLPTIMCREGDRPFAEYEADERGFNNPKGIWGKPIDVMFIGDSMTYGACLPNRDHFMAQIRERFPSTLNLGLGGVGPIINLADIREFVPKIKPKYVFYMYDENNDLYITRSNEDSDIMLEYRNPILRQYLESDQFSQNIYERKSEINTAIKQLADEVITAELAKRTLFKAAVRLLGLPLTRARLPSIRSVFGDLWPLTALAFSNAVSAQELTTQDQSSVPLAPDYLAIFKVVLSKMIQVSNAAGTKFVFVNIPAQGTLCDGIEHPWKREVLDFARESGVDFIDLERDFRNADQVTGRDAVFAVPPCGGHFSEIGYKIIGDRLLQYLNIHKALANSGDPDALLGLVQDGWSTGSSLDIPPGYKPRVAWRQTLNYEPHLNFSATLGAGSEAPTRAGGAGILGASYKLHGASSDLRLTVEFSAYSPTDNNIIAALFIGTGSEPVQFATKPVRAGTFGSVTFSHVITPPVGGILEIEVRVGSQQPGTLYINGDESEASAPDLRPSLTIEELWQVGPLVYVGAPLGNVELLKARRIIAARARQPPSFLARSFEGAKSWLVGKISTRTEFRHQQTYEPYVSISRIMDPDEPLDIEGAALLGYSWQPKSTLDLVHVRVVLPAQADQPTNITAAVFINQNIVADQVSSKELSPGQVSELVIDFEVVPARIEPISISVRVGPSRPGIVYVNGDENGPDANMPKPTLTIEEYRPFWH